MVSEQNWTMMPTTGSSGASTIHEEVTPAQEILPTMQIYTPPANLPLPKPFVTDDNLATHWTSGRKRWQDTHRSLHLHEREHQSCSASPSRHGRQGRQVSSICPEISPALELRFKSYPQYGRNTNAVWAAGHQNLGVYQEQNSPSVVMRRQQAKFHGCSDSESEQRTTPTESHIQRCSAAEYQHATKDANFSAQERLDGRRRYVLSPHCLFREGTFRASDKHDSRNSKLYCCHRYHVTEHVLLSTYANFHLFAFLLKSFSILKVSKGSILFLIHRNKGVD